MRHWIGSALILVVLGLSAAPHATPAAAQAGQAGEPPRYNHVISANPFGILLEIFNAEYETVVTRSSSVGLGGSFLSREGDDYLNADLFWRFYVGPRPLEGWAFGAKAGVTNVSEEGTFFGIGFDVNRSWLVAANDNFYVGAGFGLKRLFGAGDEDFDLEIIPTIRIINIGIAF